MIFAIFDVTDCMPAVRKEKLNALASSVVFDSKNVVLVDPSCGPASAETNAFGSDVDDDALSPKAAAASRRIGMVRMDA